MTNNKIILVDVDGVLLLWRDSFRLYMEHQGYEWINIEDDYDMSNHFDLTYDEVYKHVLQFNDGQWEFGTLPPVKGAVNGIDHLIKMGYRFVAISSCSIYPQARVLRQSNLYNIFGDVFDAVHCIDKNESKETHLNDYEPTFWIEDNFKNCIDGIKYGHKCILLSYPWNENEENQDIVRCSSWKQIVDFIDGNKNFSNIHI